MLDFLRNYRGTDRAGRLAIAVPSGGANEVAAIRVARDLRKLLNGAGIDDGQMAIRAYHAGHEANAAIRISYSRFVAEAPECRVWTENLANDPRNLPYPNLGCAQQRNLAAQIANPADLLEPRRMDPGSAERRDTVWEKYVKGEPTHAAKSQDERLQVQGAK